MRELIRVNLGMIVSIAVLVLLSSTASGAIGISTFSGFPDPDENLHLTVGETHEFTIFINNPGENSENFGLLVDGMNIIEFSDNRFEVEPGDSRKVTCQIRSEDPGMFEGTLIARVIESGSLVGQVGKPVRVMIVPELLSPFGGEIINTPIPSFGWSSGTAPSGVSYNLQIDDNSSFSDPLVFENIGIEDNFTVLPSESALKEGTYYWRIELVDGDKHFYSSASSFEIELGYPQIISLTPNLSTIGNNDVGENNFEIEITFNMEMNENEKPTISFTPEVSSTLSLASENWNSDGTQFTSTFDVMDSDMNVTGIDILVEGAESSDGLALDSKTIENVFDIRTAGLSTPSLNFPSEGETLSDSTPTFGWTPVVSKNGTFYTIQIDEENSFDDPIVYSMHDISGHQHTVTEPLEDGGYYWRVQANDDFGNSSPWSETYNFTIDTTTGAPIPPDNEQGGDNLPSENRVIVENKVSENLTRVNANLIYQPVGKTVKIDLSGFKTPFQSLSITLAKSCENGSLNASIYDVSLENLPFGGEGYKYLDIATDVSIENASFEFSVEKSWISEENLVKESIVLLHHKGENWNKLDTTIVGENSSHIFYSASTPDFSTFVITGYEFQELTYQLQETTKINENLLQVLVRIENPNNWMVSKTLEISLENVSKIFDVEIPENNVKVYSDNLDVTGIQGVQEVSLFEKGGNKSLASKEIDFGTPEPPEEPDEKTLEDYMLTLVLVVIVVSIIVTALIWWKFYS